MAGVKLNVKNTYVKTHCELCELFSSAESVISKGTKNTRVYVIVKNANVRIIQIHFNVLAGVKNLIVNVTLKSTQEQMALAQSAVCNMRKLSGKFLRKKLMRKFIL